MSLKKFLRKAFLDISDEERFEINEKEISFKMQTVVAGVTKENEFGNPIQEILQILQPNKNKPLELIREPENAYDPKAIKVYFKKKHIGYLMAQDAKKLAPKIDKGQEVHAFLKEIREYGDQELLGADIIIFIMDYDYGNK